MCGVPCTQFLKLLSRGETAVWPAAEPFPGLLCVWSAVDPGVSFSPSAVVRRMANAQFSHLAGCRNGPFHPCADARCAYPSAPAAGFWIRCNSQPQASAGDAACSLVVLAARLAASVIAGFLRGIWKASSGGYTSRGPMLASLDP